MTVENIGAKIDALTKLKQAYKKKYDAAEAAKKEVTEAEEEARKKKSDAVEKHLDFGFVGSFDERQDRDRGCGVIVEAVDRNRKKMGHLPEDENEE